VLQDDVVKFVSDPPSPPRLEDVSAEGKCKEKECCEVSEGDDTVTIEDTSNDEDEETLQERFQLRSRFSRARMPNIPVIIDRPTSLEASIPVPPRRPRNATRKLAVKKLKITETTSQEVSTMDGVVEYFLRVLCSNS
jgi:chromatin segregation and condensation protein Rec8/ScpA/Scc1 (kleisin family)